MLRRGIGRHLAFLAHFPEERRAPQERPRNGSNGKPVKVMPAKWVVGKKTGRWELGSRIGHHLTLLARLPSKRRPHQERPRNESNPKPAKFMPTKRVTIERAR